MQMVMKTDNAMIKVEYQLLMFVFFKLMPAA